MLNGYFKYGKYLFMVFLTISFYTIVSRNSGSLGLIELLLGFVFPAIPVWAAFYFFPLMTRDLEQSQIRLLAILSPLMVIFLEVYAITRLGLLDGFSPLGLLAAFGTGAIGFFLLFCLVLILSLLTRANSPTVK